MLWHPRMKRTLPPDSVHSGISAPTSALPAAAPRVPASQVAAVTTVRPMKSRVLYTEIRIVPQPNKAALSKINRYP